MFDKKYIIAFMASLMLLCSSNTYASLIGDTVDAGIYSSGNRVTGFGLEGPFTVAADISDLQTYSNVFTLDVHGDGFTIDYLTNTGSWNATTEFRIFDLDWVNQPSGIITGLQIDHNLSNWDVSRAYFGDDFVTLDWGLVVIEGDDVFVDVTLITDHAVVPVPAAAWLFGTALLGLIGFGKRRKLA